MLTPERQGPALYRSSNSTDEDQFTIRSCIWNYMLPIPYCQYNICLCPGYLTQWGRVMRICVGKLTTIGSNNGLSPGRRQAIICTNAGIFLIEPLGTNFSEILIGIQIFAFKKMRLKMLSAKWRPFCLCLNVLRIQCISRYISQYIPSPASDELMKWLLLVIFLRTAFYLRLKQGHPIIT